MNNAAANHRPTSVKFRPTSRKSQDSRAISTSFSKTVRISEKRIKELRNGTSENKFAAMALDTCCILNRNTVNVGGSEFEIKREIDQCIANTRYYDPSYFKKKSKKTKSRYKMQVFVTKESTLTAARRITEANKDQHVACLNFASPKFTGGLFLEGTNTQEDTLARSSALFVSQESPEGRKYYDHNDSKGYKFSGMATDGMIFSPHVPVFKTDSGETHQPFCVSMITSPAVSRPLCRQHKTPDSVIEKVMEQRARAILSLALEQGVKHLILGAWGCGQFGNSSKSVSNMFAKLLNEEFTGCFCSVTFPIVDHEVSILNDFRSALIVPCKK